MSCILQPNVHQHLSNVLYKQRIGCRVYERQPRRAIEITDPAPASERILSLSSRLYSPALAGRKKGVGTRRKYCSVETQRHSNCHHPPWPFPPSWSTRVTVPSHGCLFHSPRVRSSWTRSAQDDNKLESFGSLRFRIHLTHATLPAAARTTATGPAKPILPRVPTDGIAAGTGLPLRPSRSYDLPRFSF
jgi:hypothetical protein